MKLIFIRHGDPNYEIDSLTTKGWREAEFLSERIKNWKIDKIYCSPLGRAKDTASLSLKKLNREAEIKEWLKEFYYPVYHEEMGREHCPWDFLPSLWTGLIEGYDKDNWYKLQILNNPEIKPKYDEVCKGLDDILKEHGYERHEGYYLTNGLDNDETIVFFCHLGVSFVMLSHLLNISPFVLWHTFFVAPTSVTIVGAEERNKGEAQFRVQIMGDTRHLPEHNEPISGAGYFTNPFQG